MRIIPNGLDPKICDEVCDFALLQILNVDTTKKPVAMWTNYAWPSSIIQDSAPVLCFVLPDRFLKNVQLCLRENGIFDHKTDLSFLKRSKSERSICLVYLWTQNSYIPKHRDGDYRKTVTIYCNRSWSYEKGGVFQWLDTETQRWETLIPSCGTMVFNDKNEVHATTPVKTQTEFRITLQIFILPKT